MGPPFSFSHTIGSSYGNSMGPWGSSAGALEILSNSQQNLGSFSNNFGVAVSQGVRPTWALQGGRAANSCTASVEPRAGVLRICPWPWLKKRDEISESVDVGYWDSSFMHVDLLVFDVFGIISGSPILSVVFGPWPTSWGRWPLSLHDWKMFGSKMPKKTSPVSRNLAGRVWPGTGPYALRLRSLMKRWTATRYGWVMLGDAIQKETVTGLRWQLVPRSFSCAANGVPWVQRLVL